MRNKSIIGSLKCKHNMYSSGIKFLDIADQEGTEKLELRSSDGHSRPIYFSNGVPVGRSTETRAFVSHFLIKCPHYY